MALRVYFRDQNPAVDHRAFKQSNARAAEIVTKGEGEYIVDGDGLTAIQLFRNQATRDNSWMARLEEVAATPGTSSGMPFLKIHWPESVKNLRATSMIPNVRGLVSA